MADDGGVLENLPRSRPGQRSEKRGGKTAREQGPSRTKRSAGGAAKPAAKAASRAERSGSKAAAPPSGARSRSTARPKPAAGARRAAGAAAGEERPIPRGGDPVGQAIRGVAGVAATGARIADGVARELLRRLPRP